MRYVMMNFKYQSLLFSSNLMHQLRINSRTELEFKDTYILVRNVWNAVAGLFIFEEGIRFKLICSFLRSNNFLITSVSFPRPCR